MLSRPLFCALALGWAGFAAGSEYSSQPRIPDDVRGLAQKGADDLRVQHFDAAASDYLAIIDKHPDSLYGWSNLGVVRSQQGKLDEAIHAFQHATRLSPNDAFSLTDLGLCLFDEKKYDAAIPPLERAERLNPGNSNLHALLARCYAQTGRDAEARQERQTENVQQIQMFR
jgi:predicted Zn-dependent protease